MRLPAGEENVTPLRLYAEPLPPKIANVKRVCFAARSRQIHVVSINL